MQLNLSTICLGYAVLVLASLTFIYIYDHIFYGMDMDEVGKAYWRQIIAYPMVFCLLVTILSTSRGAVEGEE